VWRVVGVGDARCVEWGGALCGGLGLGVGKGGEEGEGRGGGYIKGWWCTNQCFFKKCLKHN
jgi:hypothetical protein